MDAIDKINQQIKLTAEKERLAYQTLELARIDAETSETIKQLEKNYQTQAENLQQASDAKFRQLKNRQKVLISQNTLTKKQEFLTQLFQSAAEEMGMWPKEQQESFALSVLQKLTFEESANFIVGPSMHDRLTPQFIAEITPKLSYELTYQVSEKLQASGFIVESAGIRYNFIYQELAHELQSEIGYEIAQKLFA